jgi:hypothetical protein
VVSEPIHTDVCDCSWCRVPEESACAAIGCGASPLGGPEDGPELCADCTRHDRAREERERGIDVER